MLHIVSIADRPGECIKELTISSFQRRRVIHAIAGHGHNAMSPLELMHNPELLFGRGSRKDDLFVRAEALHLHGGELLELRSCDDDALPCGRPLLVISRFNGQHIILGTSG